MHVVNVPIGHVHDFRFEPGTRGWVLTIAAEVLDEALLVSEGLRRTLSEPAVIRGTPQLRSMMKQIFAEHAAREFGRAHLLRSLSSAMIGLVVRSLANAKGRLGGSPDTGHFRRLEALLERHHQQRWSVADYAEVHADSSKPCNQVRYGRYGVAPNPKPGDKRGAAQPRLHRPSDIGDRLRSRIRRPRLFQQDILGGDRILAASLSRESPVAEARGLDEVHRLSRSLQGTVKAYENFVGLSLGIESSPRRARHCGHR